MYCPFINNFSYPFVNGFYDYGFYRQWKENISGNWDTNFGPMTLQLQPDGITVRGTYWIKDSNSWGEIFATLRPAQTRLVGYWDRKHPPKGEGACKEGSGMIQFDFYNDGFSFKGLWSCGGPGADGTPAKGWSGEWTGNRIR